MLQIISIDVDHQPSSNSPSFLLLFFSFKVCWQSCFGQIWLFFFLFVVLVLKCRDLSYHIKLKSVRSFISH